MPVTLTDELLQAARLTESELKVELAITLYQQDRLTLGQAAELAGIRQLDLQKILGARRIPIHYSQNDLQQDLATVKARLTQ